MAEEDYEIDVYGDAEVGHDQQNEDGGQDAEDYANNEEQQEQHQDLAAEHRDEENHEMQEDDQNGDDPRGDHQHEDDATISPAHQHGTKRKQDEDLPVDNNATNAVQLSDLQWFNTEAEIRAWALAGGCEDELKEITFSEHKVNGKSKGQVYVEFGTPQATSAFKRYFENMSAQSDGQLRRASVIYFSGQNPFKTLPKDAPQRQIRDNLGRGAPASGSNYQNNSTGPVNSYQNLGSGGMGSNTGGGYQGNNYRGNRGGFRGGFRGGGYNNGQGYGINNMASYNSNLGGGYNAMGGGGFNRGGMGGGFNRGGGAPMRGRGGMGMGMGMGGGAPMMGGAMGMGGMMPNMNMMGGGMGGGLGMGFPNMGGQFNPGFFGGNQGGGGNFGNNQGGGGGNFGNDWSGNPHGAKRPRGE